MLAQIVEVVQPEWLTSVTVVIGFVISVVLANLDKIKVKFNELSGFVKLFIVIGLCVVYGVVLYLGDAELSVAIEQLLLAFLSTYITYKTVVSNPPEGVGDNTKIESVG